MDLTNLRQNYRAGALRRRDLHPDPIQQFSIWFKEVHISNQVHEPNAMVLATSTCDGIPTQRTVLLKGVDSEGFRFFTNYNSEKASQMDQNPNVSLLFYWARLERQVVVGGRVKKVSKEESEAYFHSRPVGSQLGALASARQSEIIPNREVLEQRLVELEKEYANKTIPYPPFWGGYLVVPHRIDFWQGRTNRLHDRFRYLRTPENTWIIDRLSP